MACIATTAPGDNDHADADANAEDSAAAVTTAMGEQDSVSSLHRNGAANEGVVATAASSEALLAPTYSTPHEASAAYQSGLLKSDFNISSNHPSIRLAFRYLSRHLDHEVGDNDMVEDLFVCWVCQDGIPCHFRRMQPLCRNVIAAAKITNTADGACGLMEETAHGNPRGTSNKNKRPEKPSLTVNTPLVSEHDHIETTYPGHAFVFCRRVEYEQGRGAMDIVGDDESRNQDDPIVVNENGSTYFLRKTKCKEEHTTGEWESYKVVGGFRPGLEIMESEDDESGSANGCENETDINDTKSNGEKEGKTEGSDDESGDGSAYGRDYLVQLVTIQPARKNPTSSGVASSMPIKNETTTSEIELDDDDLCSNCALSVPFLRDIMNRKRRHASVFVATQNNSSNPPPGTENQTTSDHALEVTVCVTRLDPTPVDTSSKHYDRVVLGGWPCRTEPGCFPPDMDVPATGRNLLRSRFEADLRAAAASLPPHAREKLRHSTPVWIDKSQSFGPKVAPVRGRHGCFHPGSEWLVENGMNPAKRGGVEWYDAVHYLSDCDLWGPGGVMLHELSHAWHCLHIENGYDNEDIISVYKKAMEDGLYDCVPVHGSQGPRCKAYTCQDQMEFFAELSVAFLGGLQDDREHNKWYPFNRKQLRDHDPRAFAMLCRLWGVEDE